MRRDSFLFFLSVSLLSAQPAPLSGPVVGFTFDAPSKSFRAILGVLGSASFGTDIVQGLDFGSVAPHSSYGIAFSRGRGMVVTGLGSGQAQMTELPVDLNVPDRIAWSGDGSVAVLYFSATNSIQKIEGLPAAPALGSAVELLMPGSLSSIASDATGQHIAVGISGDAAGIYQTVGGQPFTELLVVSKPVAVVFSDDGSTLWAIDGATSQVFGINVANLTSQSWPLTGLSDPIAVRATRDATNRLVVYVAGRNDQSLVAYDAASQARIVQIALNFRPMSIDALGRSSFSLTSRVNADDPLWSFTNASQPAVFFVPAPPTKRPKERVR